MVSKQKGIGEVFLRERNVAAQDGNEELEVRKKTAIVQEHDGVCRRRAAEVMGTECVKEAGSTKRLPSGNTPTNMRW